jgi:phenylpropionate dioxygenase-like ring-hydroxylating dioxygenase large terminal subunit
MTMNIHPCPVPLEEFDASVLDVTKAVTLPPDCYSAPEFYEFERDAIFFRDWLCLGRAEQAPDPGDYFAITVADEPLVVVRDREGELVALSAVCRHRGTVIAEGSGNCGHTLRCPYHWWTYDLRGQLIGVPRMTDKPDFGTDSVRLPRLKVELWKGFVFASFDSDALPLGPRLTKVEPLLAGYDLENLVTTPFVEYTDLPFNWKVMMENGVEPYHAPFLHHAYVPMPPPTARGNFLPCEDGDGVMASIVELGFPDAGINPAYKIFFPPIDALSIEQRSRWVFATVPPTLMFFWQADLVSWFLLLPTGPRTVTLRWAYCLPRAIHDLPDFEDRLDMTKAGVETFNRQDFPVNARVQLGYNSRSAVRGRYADQEKILVQLNRWLVARYRARAA